MVVVAAATQAVAPRAAGAQGYLAGFRQSLAGIEVVGIQQGDAVVADGFALHRGVARHVSVPLHLLTLAQVGDGAEVLRAAADVAAERVLAFVAVHILQDIFTPIHTLLIYWPVTIL